MYIHANYNLRQHNTFNIDCIARFFVEIKHASAIPVMRHDPILAALPWQIIGGGSNLLLTKDLDAVVLSCNYDEIKIVKEDELSVWLSVGSGCNWHDLVTYSVNNGWWGLENLALIPGKVGAAPVQNIGAYGAEVQDTITRIQTFDLRDGTRIELRKNECNFGYRDSIFKKELADRVLIHRVTFRLLKQSKANLVHEPLHEAIVNKGLRVDTLTPKDVYDAIIALRTQKIPDPKVLGSAGSFFKNPSISLKHYQHLQETYPDIPGHKQVNGCIKIPAAWLIEQAGWKGKKVGHVGTYQKHALIVVNYGGATGREVIEVSEMIQNDVINMFSISLEKEVVVL
ncbi:MAG: UDP-N-acetylmuramate dehydrogenase [Thiotrichales bacterium]|jgi:UDP-N-acetylmuramate dehydrogenase|nr:UDP-N-acetylmuramate dehydrogenase [Thiotrichales bacterium]